MSKPFEVYHTEKELPELTPMLLRLYGDIHVVMQLLESTLCRNYDI